MQRPNKSFRYALWLTCLAISAALLVFIISYRRAAAALSHIKLEARNASGTIFYASPKRYFVGQTLSRQTVVEHLSAINFSLADAPGTPGSYALEGPAKLSITPRLPEFQPVQLTFKGSQLIALERAGQPVQEVLVEPEVLNTAITMIDGDAQSVMNVRRAVVQPADVLGTDLYFAAIASEDKTFPSHHGLNYPAYLRLPYYKARGWRTGGASSITTQTCKNAILQDKTRTASRKWDEMLCALALEERMSKEDIFTLYANSVFLGGAKGSPNVYGFLAAAQQYFGKEKLAALSLSEASTLVAMLPKPNDFLIPARRGDYAELTVWRNRVLRLMGELFPEKYSAAAIQSAQNEPVHFVVNTQQTEQPLDKITRGYLSLAKEQDFLAQLTQLPPQEVSSAHIYTPLDTDLQREAVRIVSQRLPELEKQFPPVAPRDCGGQPERLVGIIVALDPQTGEIITLYGGAGGPEGTQVEASQTRNAAASDFKPCLATANLAAGNFTAASVIDGSKTQIGNWQPTQGVCGAGRVRSLLAASCDDFAAYALAQLGGPTAGAKLFEKLTGESIKNPVPALALGFGETEITALQMARLYAAYANGGHLVVPSPLSHIYLDGQEVVLPQPAQVPVMEPGAAFITVQMLRSVLGYGPDGVRGTAAQAFRSTGLSLDQVEMAGKTGSGPHGVWMVSVSPKLVVAVSVTYRCHSEIKGSEKLFAANTAARLWAEYLVSIKRQRPDLLTGHFSQPANVVKARIDARTGCRTEAARGQEEYFLVGHEPTACH